MVLAIVIICLCIFISFNDMKNVDAPSFRVKSNAKSLSQCLWKRTFWVIFVKIKDFMHDAPTCKKNDFKWNHIGYWLIKNATAFGIRHISLNVYTKSSVQWWYLIFVKLSNFRTDLIVYGFLQVFLIIVKDNKALTCIYWDLLSMVIHYGWWLVGLRSTNFCRFSGKGTWKKWRSRGIF